MRRELLALALLACGAGCRAAPSGVLVTLDVASGDADGLVWSDDLAFDHITIVATAGSTQRVACLSSTSAGDASTAVVLDASSSDAGAVDPCADVTAFAWTNAGVPTYATWKMSQALPASVELAVESGQLVTVTATAYLGGGTTPHPVGSVTGTATSASGSPKLPLLLQRQSGPPPCGVTLLSAAVDAMDAGLGFCSSSETTNALCRYCPILGDLSDGGPRYADCVGASAAAECSNDEIVVEAVDAGCATGLATRARACNGVTSTYLQFNAMGHFYRCVDGGDPTTCVKTSNCTPPASIHAVLRYAYDEDLVRPLHAAGDIVPDASVDLSCMPPFAFEVPFSFNFTTTGGAYWLEVDVSPDPSSCVFEWSQTQEAMSCN